MKHSLKPTGNFCLCTNDASILHIYNYLLDSIIAMGRLETTQDKCVGR